MVGSILPQADPSAAAEVVRAVFESITKTTRDSYASGVNHYTAWALDRGIDPFPVDPIVLAAWVLYACALISLATVQKYLSGIRRFQLDSCAAPWSPQGNHIFSAVLRSCKRRWPAAAKRLKFPVSVLVNKMFHSVLNFDRHNDRMFFAASTCATAGLWRGGEFLLSKTSTLPQRLLVSNFLIHADRVDVSILASKTKFWRTDVVTPLYAVDSVVCPYKALKGYMDRSVVPLFPSNFMFVLANGSPLTKAWMLQRTRSLLTRLHLPHDRVFAASWRSGGAMSLRWAGTQPDITLAMGRWSSSAGLDYFMTANADIEGAASRAAALSVSDVKARGYSPFLVGEFTAARVFNDH